MSTNPRLGLQTIRTATPARTTRPLDDDVDGRLELADAALGAAGHQVTDPALRDLRRRAATGEMTVEEALAAGLAHLDAR